MSVCVPEKSVMLYCTRLSPGAVERAAEYVAAMLSLPGQPDLGTITFSDDHQMFVPPGLMRLTPSLLGICEGTALQVEGYWNESPGMCGDVYRV